MRYRNIIFDFDGVLVESNQIRLAGFQALFSKASSSEKEALAQFICQNGGLSRYRKIRFFFENICKKQVTDHEVEALAKEYSRIVKDEVIRAPYVEGAFDFLQKYSHVCNLAIVSGSDQEELQEVCRRRRIDRFFKKILGAPASKEENLSLLFLEGFWKKGESLFVGDSVNDLEAARFHAIDFIGRNSDFTNWVFFKPGVIQLNNIKELEAYMF